MIAVGADSLHLSRWWPMEPQHLWCPSESRALLCVPPSEDTTFLGQVRGEIKIGNTLVIFDFFHRPGSLKRSLASQSLDNGSSKRSRTSSISSMNSLYVGGIPSSIRNAIASSYSSTRGLSQVCCPWCLAGF